MIITSTTTSAASATAAPEAGFIDHLIRFQEVCFSGEEFPLCDFDDPAAVRGLIGPYTISVKYFDGSGRLVTRAATLGRYAAVVEIEHGGKVSKRFVTLCRLDAPASAASAESLGKAGIDGELIEQHATELAAKNPRASVGKPAPDAGAVNAAGLFDLTAMRRQQQSLPPDTLDQLDRQWWVTFKRRYYGYDKIYSKPFVCPQQVDGPPARVIHEGTLEEAGMKPDALETIDKACEAWANDQEIGFSLCVVRHGVIVVHKAYGKRADKAHQGQPFEVDTVTGLASTTKFLSSMLLAEFADQGLIGIDDPIDKYLPQLKALPVKTAPTIRDLYLHTAGFTGHWGDWNHDMEELVADIYPTLQVRARHQYQGVGLALAGKIMENISGESIPRLYRRRLLEPLQCTHTKLELTSYGSVSNSMELARIGQMMLNGGSYGKLRFTSQRVIDQMVPQKGNDRFEPDKSIRWGVGTKIFDSDGFSEQAYGGSGATGPFLKVDPAYDLVIAMVRDKEGDKFLKWRGDTIKAVLGAVRK
jgi:CubicO group peptidase (beta-lactamase class C family)